MTFNFVAGFVLYAIGWFLIGTIYGQPYHAANPWRLAWFYTGAATIALLGGLAILKGI